MTPRKELFIEIKKALVANVSELELVDLDRKQFDQTEKESPGCFTACLIKSPTIQWQTMVENVKEGTAEIEVTLYTKDGWLNQHNTTEDNEHGLIEIDLIDKVTEALEFLYGESFKPLELINEEESEISEKELMSFRLTFSTMVYKRVNYPYQKKKLTLTPQ